MDVPGRFGDYRLDAVLGRGGMGVVYEAYDEVHQRRVALKLLAPALADDQHYQTRFLQEARTVAGLSSPHIIPIHTFGVQRDDDRSGAQDRLFLDMALVEGRDLGAALADGPMDGERAVSIIEQVADALEAAHEQGLVHRDVKPGNVLLTRRRQGHRDFVYLCDFGLARPVTGSAGLTMTGTVMGTVDYMPPEQIEARPLDHRADVYALGCLLFHTLAGHPPFRASSQVLVMDAHRSAPVPALPSGSPAMDAVLAIALAKDPADRFPGALALAGAARDALAGVAPRLDALSTAGSGVERGEQETVVASAARARAGEPPISDQVTQAPHGRPAHAPTPPPPTPPPPTPPMGLLEPFAAGPGQPGPSGPTPRRARHRGLLVAAVVAGVVLLGVVGTLATVIGLGVARWASSSSTDTPGSSAAASSPGAASGPASTSDTSTPSTSTPAASSTLSAAEQALRARLPADVSDCEPATSDTTQTFGGAQPTAVLYCGTRHLDGGYVYAYSYADEGARDSAFADFTQLPTDDQGPCPTLDGSGPWHTAGGAVGGTAACYLVDDSDTSSATGSPADGTADSPAGAASAAPDTSSPAPQHAVMAWTRAGTPDFVVVAVDGQDDMNPAYTWHLRYVAQETP